MIDWRICKHCGKEIMLESLLAGRFERWMGSRENPWCPEPRSTWHQSVDTPHELSMNAGKPEGWTP